MNNISKIRNYQIHSVELSETDRVIFDTKFPILCDKNIEFFTGFVVFDVTNRFRSGIHMCSSYIVEKDENVVTTLNSQYELIEPGELIPELQGDQGIKALMYEQKVLVETIKQLKSLESQGFKIKGIC